MSGSRSGAPADELAHEWALLQAVECGRLPRAWHLWEAAAPAVVVGRSTSIDDHVLEEACRADRVDVLRRRSGGGAVVLGPGCLNYAVVLPLDACPALANVTRSFRFILEQIAAALDVPGLMVSGETDLAIHGRKVSGNAQRRERRALMHHGTVLYDFDATLAARYLNEPMRRPAYRHQRSHVEFMGNLPASRDALWSRLAAALPTVGQGFSPAGGRDSCAAPTERRRPPRACGIRHESP